VRSYAKGEAVAGARQVRTLSVLSGTSTARPESPSNVQEAK